MTDKLIYLHINKKVGNTKVGDVVECPLDKNGVIIDRFWRKRLKDSELDQCVTVYTEKEKVPTKPVVSKKLEHKARKIKGVVKPSTVKNKRPAAKKPPAKPRTPSKIKTSPKRKTDA